MSGKKDCDVALDLMLLAQEGLSRDGSRAFLQEHMENCPSCRETYEALKLQPESLQAPDNAAQEDQALRKGMKRAGKRMRLWKRIVAGCVLLVLVVLAINGVQAWRWNRTAALPLELYEVEMASYEAVLHLDVECFATNIYGFSMKAIPEDGYGLMADGDPVIVTYQVEYYPLRAEQEKLLSPASRWEVLDYHSMCIKDGQVYMVAESEITKEAGRDVALMTPGSPVLEIRVTDGRNTRTIYTQGDEIAEKLRYDSDKPAFFRLAE